MRYSRIWQRQQQAIARPIIYALWLYWKSRWILPQKSSSQMGFFWQKAFRGGADASFMTLLNQRFDKVRYLKPEASRAESVETYLLATGFKPAPDTDDA